MADLKSDIGISGSRDIPLRRIEYKTSALPTELTGHYYLHPVIILKVFWRHDCLKRKQYFWIKNNNTFKILKAQI